MGFFKVNCAICDAPVGLNRFYIAKTKDGKSMWKCPACARKGGFLVINYDTGKVIIVKSPDEIDQ